MVNEQRDLNVMSEPLNKIQFLKIREINVAINIGASLG